ncbi:sensor histidine kinase [Roseofilum casamattae]|uniref:histidine kinase n=1 Tax=Roseofilum casamattae BLCC-M143 TaxID=3022442 RepID=A0ABT7C1P6_9CYAN|nr:HAMP domain-containing sensor histidine kinase [Roseofilum casamattae]MDJ1185369.1 HAMP domain-containing sensor histidine kinase [Roseofilum casamattae BLCC-M143]
MKLASMQTRGTADLNAIAIAQYPHYKSSPSPEEPSSNSDREEPSSTLYPPEPKEPETFTPASNRVTTSGSNTNAQTLRQFQQLVTERTAQLELSLKVQAKLYEQTRRQVEELRHLNQLKDEFLSTVSHELRTPLTSMTLAIRMLRQPGISPERQQKYLDILEAQCQQEVNLINDLLTLQELESNAIDLDYQPLDIGKSIARETARFATQWGHKEIEVRLDVAPELPMIHTEEDSFRGIVAELLSNAGKFSQPGTEVVVRVKPDTSDANNVQISISNQGIGIESSERPYIFDKFRRGTGVTAKAIAGTGLGLALVKGLVEQLGGTISVTSYPLTSEVIWETCFTLILPQG